jgi:chromosome segregation ATPase
MESIDQVQFANSNSDLFAINGFKELLENQDFDGIQKALEKTLGESDEYIKLLRDANQNYEAAKAIHGENSVEAQIAKMTLDSIKDTDKLFSASLETRKAQQDKQLAMYKKTLEKEKDALTKSLEDRKEAYQKYFDTINQAQEDEDYEEKFNTLAENITKLNGSNAATEAKRMELEKQMVELEKERLETLRQRGQEQVISNIENEVEEIKNKFDELLQSNDALLQAMLNTNSSDLLAKLMTTQLTSEENSVLDMQA